MVGEASAWRPTVSTEGTTPPVSSTGGAVWTSRSQQQQQTTVWSEVSHSGFATGFRFRRDAGALFPRAGHDQLPVREGAAVAALPRRARAAPLPVGRGALHRLQTLRGHLSGAGHHHRGRAALRRLAPHHALRHRHDQVHLLRLLPGPVSLLGFLCGEGRVMKQT